MRIKRQPRDFCTPEESSYIDEFGIKFEDDGSKFGLATVIHPKRLHKKFVKRNKNLNHELMAEIDLGDGWIQSTYRLESKTLVLGQ